MNSAERCEFDKKNRPITSGDTIQGGRTCSDRLLLLQNLISAGTLKYAYYFYSSSGTVVSSSSEAFYFEYVRTKRAR